MQACVLCKPCLNEKDFARCLYDWVSLYAFVWRLNILCLAFFPPDFECRYCTLLWEDQQSQSSSQGSGFLWFPEEMKKAPQKLPEVCIKPVLSLNDECCVQVKQTDVVLLSFWERFLCLPRACVRERTGTSCHLLAVRWCDVEIVTSGHLAS